ncbi:MAG TPA: FAD-binding oxidoreductase [Vicinamibacterales bacterium]|nr:FAD-binding oxidoreductase [Vicinamibacterales bacterium]
MPTWHTTTRAPRGVVTTSVRTDPDIVRGLLEDAAHYPGGHAAGVAFVTTEADVAAALASAAAVLPIGEQSSLTGAATPMGELLLATSHATAILGTGPGTVRVQAGVPLAALNRVLAASNRCYPPVPTYDGARVGGTVATNAAGAATFKYGSTRHWVQALTVVLACGEVLDLVRGEVTAHPDGFFTIETGCRGVVRVPVPTYRMPDVPKCSAGYFAAPGMDLIDLFIGAEGTLGVITEVTLRVLPRRPAVCVALVPFRDERLGIATVRRLRAASLQTRETGDPHGLDVSAIEHLDRRSIQLVHEDGADRRLGVALPADAALALLVQLELPAGVDAATAFDQIGLARAPDAPDTPLIRFCRLLDEAAVLDETEVAVPGDEARAAQLFALREAVPAAVNARVGRAKQTIDGRIEKTAADMIVPFDRFEEMMAVYRDGFARRGLDYAIWGHISDGNVHPNVIPHSYADVEAGKAAILDFGREVARLGGCPLAEHGVGRNPVKQALLREFYGPQGLAEMRAVKQALDPEWKLAPGVLFQRE